MKKKYKIITPEHYAKLRLTNKLPAIYNNLGKELLQKRYNDHSSRIHR
jgi:hypothetical protein